MKVKQRKFLIGDLEMLEKSQVFLNAFIKEKAIFVAKFPNLTDPFADEFQVAIDFADSLPSSYEINTLISVAVEKLRKKMALAQKDLQILFNYVNIGWESVAKMNEFGKNKYLKARENYGKMIELLELAYNTAQESENKAVLLNVGYSQVQIDELNTLANELDAMIMQLNEMKSNRFVLTEERITAMNNVWTYMKRLNKASKVVFVDNPAMLKLFLLYPTSHSKAKKLKKTTEEVFETA